MNRESIERYLAAAPSPACAYLYDLDHLRRRAARLVAALPDGCELFYAVKANSDAPVLGALAGAVAGYEVASLGEIERVREAVGAARIAFGGPGKTDRELRGALEHGVELIHVESELQLRRLDAVAREHGSRARVLLRVNPKPFAADDGGPGATGTLTMGGRPTQFGIDEDEVPALIALAASLPGVQLVGLHLHALSNNLDAASHLALMRHYLTLATALRERHGLVLETLNVGGGIGVDYANPDREFDWPLFCRGLRALLADTAAGCRIVFECGRFVAADCGCYVTEVIDLKRNHGRHFAVLRGGTHHFRLPASWQHDHPFFVVPNEAWPYTFARPQLEDGELSLCGELCTPKDVLAAHARVARLRVGDRIVFRLAGAYGWHISHHDFLSHPHPERIYLGAPS
ncbi:type III PLP-dependent enzyme [Burkholderia plantarii]|uniref:type III PLP-dependent enzyme n=1 Tax=Burkholderia plantarii TaxID=41899 RepID=UPI0006D892BD|nr:type III PLP-dependent enzyme [Burkholderia plantarii]ALK32771.1 diaminopimelate decarboxylase protein [Burkholderia plantarii]GLZ22792.1 staphyloferrin B biosynthesis decarboxylase SbnH [Burkholderia plantarii]